MIKNAKLAEYLDAIQSAKEGRSESVLSKVADSFEDDLLEYEDFPPDYFDFFLELISNKEIFRVPGVWNFFLVLSTEKQKMLRPHYEAIEKRILENYLDYANEDLCLAVCDFIARNYDHAWAKSIFENLKAIEKNKNSDLQGFVEDGLRILEREIARG